MTLHVIYMTDDDQLVLKYSTAAIAGAIGGGRTWSSLNDTEEDPNPRADDDQGERLLLLHQATAGLPKAGLLLELEHQQAQDICDAISWVKGQLPWSPLWEVGDQPEPTADWGHAGLLIESENITAKLAESMNSSGE